MNSSHSATAHHAASSEGSVRLRQLFVTSDDPAATVLRTVLAGVMFPHGAQHLVGWFGGYGFAGTYQWMNETVGIPGVFAALAIVLEFFAPLFLLAGLGGRLSAAILGIILCVAATTHFQNGFFMNWFGTSPGEGWEFHLLGVAMALALVIRGSGKWSLDLLLFEE